MPRRLAILLASRLLLPGSALAVDGPGLGNLSYAPGELFQPVSVLQSPLGQGNAALVNGYLMLTYSSDGGGTAGDGGFEFWDVSDPRNPLLAKGYDNADTHGIREPSTFGFSAGATDVMVTQAVDGIQFWDLTDPMNMQLLDYLDLPGVTASAYTTGWWLFWQDPFVYFAGTAGGLYIVDASDPANPVLVNQLPTSALGGLSPGLVWAVGNLLILTANNGAGYATMDISDPANPVLIQNIPGLAGYSHLFAAGKILTSGGAGGANVMGVHSVGHDGLMALVGSAGSGLGNGGYGSYQDGLFHSGFSTLYAKFDIASLTQLGTGTSGIVDRDEDSGQVFGNLVFVGNDHAQGTALIVHQIAPDSLGPDVHWVHPADGATGLAPTTRVGLSMSDMIDVDSLDASSFTVRPQGGAALPGRYSTQMGLVNFTPDAPLAADTVYEVVVNGLEDWVGNPGGSFASSFTTGGEGPPTCALDPFVAEEVGVSVSFDVASVAGSLPITYSWDFGDGSPPTAPSTSSATSHAYTAPGRYGVILSVENLFGISSCALVQIAHAPVTATAPSASGPIVHDGSRSYSVNPDNDTVSAIDDLTLAKLWESPVGDNPRTLALAPDGKLWVANQGDASVSVLSPAGALVDSIALPFASQPYAIAFRPDGAAAYVSLVARGELLELDPAGNIVASVALGPKPRGIAITGDSSRILVTRFVSPASQGEIWEIDAATLSLTATRSLHFDPGPDTEASGRGVPNYLSALGISPDGGSALIPSKKDNTARGLFNDGLPLTFESRTRTIVSRLDLLTNSEDVGARMDLNDRDMAQALLFSPLGDLFLVAAQGSNRIEVFDANDATLLGGMNTGRAPQGMAWNADASRLYVQNFMSRTVSVFDTADLVSAAANFAPLLAEVSTVASEALATDVLQGKQIFYDASDPRMSQDGYISCASCHLDGGSDGRIWDFSQAGEGLRNTIALTGRGGLEHGNVHWTANFDEIQDFENDIRGGFSGTGFLSDPDFAATSDPLGAPKATLSVELDALAAYVSSLGHFPDSPERNPDGSLTTNAQAGKALFATLGCASCHTGNAFSDGLRHDVGTIQASSGQGIGLPLAGVGFETPTLKGLWNSAPYLHNGQAATLEDLLDSATHGGTDTLTPLQRSRLAAYLRQIDERENAACADGLDNDGDGRVDFDRGVSATGSAQSVDPDPQCAGQPEKRKERAGCGLGAELVLLMLALGQGRQRSLRRRDAKASRG